MLYALDGRTGAKLWSFKTGLAVRSSPAIGADGVLYVGSEDKKLYALDLKTGKMRWAFETKGKIDSSPVIGKNGILYVGSSDKKVYALRCDSSGLAPSAWPCFGQNSLRSRHLDFSRIKFPFLNLGD
jgi:outer membrane protein assembly factor BamB